MGCSYCQIKLLVPENEASGGGKMDVQCDGRGVCGEVRECFRTCANAIALGSVGNEPASGNDAGICGGRTWSYSIGMVPHTILTKSFHSDEIGIFGGQVFHGLIDALDRAIARSAIYGGI